jgi:anthranilate synthase component 1
MHLVSDVVGKVEPGRTPFDLLRATFPAGTVSGAPKVKAVEIIGELEGERRGPYAGAIGYVAPDGACDFAITIRTAYIEPTRVHAFAGAGIVLQSDPASELAEVANKAAVVREAIAACARAGSTATGETR